MRKSRVRITDINEGIFEELARDQTKFFDNLDILSINVPKWAAVAFIFMRLDRKSIELTFYEDAKDFFMYYTKRLVRRQGDYRVACFSREESEDWRPFIPPTLIGVNLKTKLRSNDNKL